MTTVTVGQLEEFLKDKPKNAIIMLRTSPYHWQGADLSEMVFRPNMWMLPRSADAIVLGPKLKEHKVENSKVIEL